MIVEELIQLLKEFPPSQVVMFDSGDRGMWPVTEVKGVADMYYGSSLPVVLLGGKR